MYKGSDPSRLWDFKTHRLSVRCFKPFITNHRHYNHHHKLRSTARSRGEAPSIPFTGGNPNRWLARATTARVEAPFSPCTIIFTTNCSQRHSWQGGSHTQHNPNGFCKYWKNITSQPSKIEFMEFHVLFSLGFSAVLQNRPNHQQCSQRFVKRQERL